VLGCRAEKKKADVCPPGKDEGKERAVGVAPAEEGFCIVKCSEVWKNPQSRELSLKVGIEKKKEKKRFSTPATNLRKSK